MVIAMSSSNVLAVDNKPVDNSATQVQTKASLDTNSKVSQQNQEQLAEKRKQINAEALAAITETQNALKAMDDGNKKEALAALEHATGKLELILAREPKIALAPTSVSGATISVIGDTEKLKTIRKEAAKLLDNGQVQAARHLLSGYASETVISVANIPFATYPAAIKQAAKLVDEGKTDEAKSVLQTALNTLVISNTVIPLPVVSSEAMLREAETLSENTKRTDAENKRLNELLTAAYGQLKLAEVLGYGTKADFKGLYDQLYEIKSKTSGGKSGSGFFAKIKTSLSDLIKSNQQPNIK